MKCWRVVQWILSKLSILTGVVLVAAPSVFAAERLPVCVSILPQKYFVQQIAGDLAAVQVMVSPGASPATYEPKPRQMAGLRDTRLYLAIGVAFEDAWLEKISAVNPNMKVVHTDQGIEKIPMADVDPEAGAAVHAEGAHEDGAHAHHGGLDPHIWLSPPLVKHQALTILAALQAADPAHAEAYEENCERFLSEIEALDAGLETMFGQGQGTARFMVFHPSWGYFARAYGLEQVPIEIEGKDPKPAQLKAIIEQAREEGIRVIFAQPQFSTRSAELVAREIGGRVALVDPLAEDWAANLRSVAEAFRDALE